MADLKSVSAPTLGAHFLPPNIGSYLAYTGERVGCDEMLKHHSSNFEVSPDQMMAKCEEITRKILINAPLAVWETKEAIISGLDMNLEQRMTIATMLFERVQGSEDTQEGLSAFAEEMPPTWKAK